MAVRSGDRSLPGTAVFAAVIAGAVVGAVIGALAIAFDVGDPSYSGPDTRSAGLAAIAAMIGAGPGVLAGLLVGLGIWKLDYLLLRSSSFFWRSVIECVLIAAFTILCSSLAFRGLPAGTIAMVVLGGALVALALSAGYFAWRYRRFHETRMV